MNEHLNPDKIKIINSDGVISDIYFNILNWISPSIKKYFSDEEILKVLSDENILYDHLVESMELVIKKGAKLTNLPEIHDVCFSSSKYKTEYVNRCLISVEYIRYHFNIPSNMIYGKLMLCLLINKIGFLSKSIYSKLENIPFDVKKCATSSNRLIDMPLELRNFTINEILSIQDIYYYTKLIPNFVTYSDGEIYYTPNHKPNDWFPSLHINIESLLSGDWESIEQSTRKYYKEYYSGGWSNVIENYPIVKDRLLWIDEIFNLPDVLELKNDILNINK